MDLYTTNFIIALLVAVAIAVTRMKSIRWRIAALFVIPLLDFAFFFNLDYRWLTGIFPIVGCYLGAVFVLLFFFLLSSCRKISVQTSLVKHEKLRLIVLFVCQYFLFLYVLLIPWAIDTFPLSNVDAVLFTVFSGENEGAEEFVLSNFVDSALIPSIQSYAILIVVQVLVALLMLRRKLFIEFRLRRIKITIASKNFVGYLYKLEKCTSVFLLAVCLVLSLVLPKIVMSACFEVLFERPVDSELYRNHYVSPPDSVKINQSGKMKNLIVIFMESMETNFHHYTPEIKEIEQQNTNFRPGGVSVAGTSWTMGAITSKLCGIPLNMPMKMDEYHGRLPSYIPYARCLSDVLFDKGYEQIFIQGSSGGFTQMRDFCAAHGNIALHDLEFFKEKKIVPNNYHVFWGVEDRKVYDYAKKELADMSKNNQPFAYYIATMDTHLPEGYVDSICVNEFMSVEKPYPKVLRCASRQLEDFLSWAERQSWYDNTVISVMGDHTMPALSSKAEVPFSDSLYWTNFVINSAVTTPVRERQYSSLDMFPTLLEAMGFELENRSAGLGRSLYSDSLTMLELYGRKTLDSLLRERSIQYDVFLLGEKK